jgi:acyl-CoA synthetase (AMP-forming)/AMP-acid ligase II
VALVELLERRRLERPGDDFLYAGGETWSAARLADRADACAAALAAAGVQRGHHVALMLENSADFLACFFGVAKLGAVAVTLNPGLRGDTLAYILDHSDARVLVLEGELAGAAAAAIDGASRLETVWARGCGAGHVALEEQLDGRRAAPEPVKRGPGECTAILYTSGTTGRPKGVMLTDYGYERASE